MSVELELTCPVCLHDAGMLLVDDTMQHRCPGCQILLGIGPTKLLMPLEGFEPPQRQLTRRVEAPKRTKVRLRRVGDALRAWIRMGIITPFAKRIELSPSGYTLRTWRGRGTEMPLGDFVGVIAMQLYVGVLPGDHAEHRADFLWVSTLVYRNSGDFFYKPLYVHSREDAAYFASVINAHAVELRNASAHPYRGA